MTTEIVAAVNAAFAGACRVVGRKWNVRRIAPGGTVPWAVGGPVRFWGVRRSASVGTVLGAPVHKSMACIKFVQLNY